MKKIALVLALLIIVSLSTHSQDYKGKARLIGYVHDEQGVPLDGVRVKCFFVKAQAGFDVMSDKDGMWVAAWIRGGGWNIDFDKIGYVPKKINVDVQELKKNPEIKVNLKKIEGLVLTDELKNLLVQGNVLFEQKKYAEAIDVFRGILEKYPDAYIININLGNCYFQQEKYDQAEQHYLKVLEKDPKNVAALLLMGNTYANRNDSEKAREWYGKVDFDRIDDPIVLYNLGTNYYNSGKFEDAMKCYRKAVEIQKDFADGLYQLGLTFLNLGKNAESLAAFESYLKLDSESQRAGQAKSFIDFLKKK